MPEQNKGKEITSFMPFSHTITHFDWSQAVAEAQRDSAVYYGDKPHIKGAHTVSSFTQHRPFRELKNDAQVEHYVRIRIKALKPNTGEVINIRPAGYAILTSEVLEFRGRLNVDMAIFQQTDKTAVLYNHKMVMVASGTIAEMQKYAKYLIFEEKFAHEYYIVRKNSDIYYRVMPKRRTVKTTSLRTDEKALKAVLPLYQFEIYGRAE